MNLTRFDPFVPEKRPFFLENASVFQFGARLSGKIGHYNVGSSTCRPPRSWISRPAIYNDRRDTTDFNPQETLGRSFIVKYTRLFDF